MDDMLDPSPKLLPVLLFLIPLKSKSKGAAGALCWAGVAPELPPKSR